MASYQFCAKIAQREARNFYHAFLLLPRDRRLAMCALYAFLRHTDDLADEPGTAEQKTAALEQWRGALDAALEGQALAWPGLPAVADTVSRRSIPHEYLHAVIDGVSMDMQPRGFADFGELADYCYHVASVVGLCCIHIWGYRSDGGRAERLAEGCGIALQLTNILRDIREDARNGRIYLPREEMDRFGVDRPRSRREPDQSVRQGSAGLPGPPSLRILRPGSRARAAGRSHRPAGSADDHGHLSCLARRDCEA